MPGAAGVSTQPRADRGQHGPTAALQFQCVGRKGDLLWAQLDQVASPTQALLHLAPALRVADHVKPAHRNPGADAQHHAGVVAGLARCVGRKHHGPVLKVGAALQRHRVGGATAV